MTTEPYTPDEAELIGCYAGAMEEHAGEDYATAKADAERGIAKIRADERQSLLEELTADAEHEARIGEQGNDSERVNAAEKIIEMLNDIQIEREA